MERVIKFRGKRLDTGQWVYGDLLTNTTPFEILAYKGQYSVNQDTVGQYVNIIDINGREIYEGDMIRKLILAIKKIRVCKSNKWNCYECPYYTFVWHGTICRGIKCLFPHKN